jgi:cytochrome P450
VTADPANTPATPTTAPAVAPAVETAPAAPTGPAGPTAPGAPAGLGSGPARGVAAATGRSGSRGVPRALPVLGHAVYLLRRPQEFVTRMRDAGEVTVFRLGPRSAYLVNTPELVHQVLVTRRAAFDKGGALFAQATELVGTGLVTSGAELHRRQRRLAQPAFHAARIAAYTAIMRDSVVARSAAWRPGAVLELFTETHALSMDILARTLFTPPPGVDAVAVIQRNLPVLLGGIPRRAYLPVPWLHRLPLPVNRRFYAARAALFDLVDRIIADYAATGADRGDLLSMLMLARDADTGEPMSHRQLRDEVMTMLLAGTETSSSTLVWAFHALARQPEAEQRVHAEVDAVLAGRPAGHEDLPALNYVGRVVREVLRMYPVGWLLTRITLAEVELGGVRIPAGSDVFFSPYALHHDPALFADPERFDPDRWLPERAGEIPRHAYIPFGDGNRKCIGDVFGMTEVAVALATLAGRWRLRPVPGRPPRPVAGSSYRLAEAYMQLEPRWPDAAAAPDRD